MTISGAYYDQIKQENINLEEFVIELFQENIGSNIRLIRECLLDWQNTKRIIDNVGCNEDQIPQGDVRRTS